MTRPFPRRHLDMPDPRGLFLGPILRGGHVSAIYLPLRATWGALEAPPDPSLLLARSRTDAQQHRRRQAANATSCVPRAAASVLLSAPPHHTASALSLSAACNPQIPHTQGAARTNLRVASSPSFQFVEMWCCAGWWCSFLGVGSPTAVRIRPAGGVVGRVRT